MDNKNKSTTSHNGKAANNDGQKGAHASNASKSSASHGTRQDKAWQEEQEGEE